jgi:hypothetical protein
MSLKHILALAGAKTSLNPAQPSQRSVLLRWANEAAEEIYYESDTVSSQYEQVFKVNGDQTVSMPWYVGPIRGIREVDSQIVWSTNRMRPRYAQFNWPDSWRNIRLIGERALQATITNQSALVITIPQVENPPIQVMITGSTQNASSVSETITMTSVSMQTVNNYTDVTSCKKNIINQFDVTISDIDGKLITTIPNNRYDARYQIYDVSVCPWLAVSTSSLEHYVEILFKWALLPLFNDTDEFLNTGKYDYVIVTKMIQLWNEEQGKADIATALDTKASRSIARITQDQHRNTEDAVNFIANPHDQLLPRVRPGRRKYYRGYGSRGYGY